MPAKPSYVDAPAELRAKCRLRNGMSAEMLVLDISAGGCMVEARGWSGRQGERVLLTLPGLAAQPGEVVWVEDERAGIAFEDALYEPVLVRFEQMLAEASAR